MTGYAAAAAGDNDMMVMMDGRFRRDRWDDTDQDGWIGDGDPGYDGDDEEAAWWPEASSGGPGWDGDGRGMGWDDGMDDGWTMMVG